MNLKFLGNAFQIILNSCDDYGNVTLECGLKGIPINACLGDQQAACVGHGLFNNGGAKNTYGTGVFMMVNTGENILNIPGCITTVCYKLGKDSKAVYALEGAIECGGTTINWMKDKLGLFDKYEEIETIVAGTQSNAGVYFVPAFCGLYAPEWRDNAKGVIVGLTNFAERAHILRAGLEAICYRTKDVLDCITQNSDLKIESMKVDGGLTVNKFLMKFQANLLQKSLNKSKINDATPFGVGIAAAYHAKIYKSLDDIQHLFLTDDPITFDDKAKEEYEKYYLGWKQALPKSFNS